VVRRLGNVVIKGFVERVNQESGLHAINI
jgi:hypothetical protein